MASEKCNIYAKCCNERNSWLLLAVYATIQIQLQHLKSKFYLFGKLGSISRPESTISQPLPTNRNSLKYTRSWMVPKMSCDVLKYSKFHEAKVGLYCCQCRCAERFVARCWKCCSQLKITCRPILLHFSFHPRFDQIICCCFPILFLGIMF